MTTNVIALPDAAILLAAVLYLMTKYAERACPSVRRAIESHLFWLAQHPSDQITPAERATYSRLAKQWAQIGARARSAGLVHRHAVHSLAPTLQ